MGDKALTCLTGESAGWPASHLYGQVNHMSAARAVQMDCQQAANVAQQRPGFHRHASGPFQERIGGRLAGRDAVHYFAFLMTQF